MKFLIDECLSPTLVDLAWSAGHWESAHVTRRGMTSWEDHRLMRVIIAEDWTMVTQNGDDFRPRPGSSSLAPCYVGQPLHAGLICLNLPGNTDWEDQMNYFRHALDRIAAEKLTDLVNKIIEVDPDVGSASRVAAKIRDYPEDDA